MANAYTVEQQTAREGKEEVFVARSYPLGEELRVRESHETIPCLHDVPSTVDSAIRNASELERGGQG